MATLQRSREGEGASMAEQKHPKIAVDSREPDEICDYLEALGAELELLQLSLGDYQVSDRLIIERKTRADFESSIVDGRLFTQIAGLCEEGRRIVLLVEGSGDSESRLARGALLGAYASIIADFGCSLFFTRSAQATAELVFNLACHEQLSKSQSLSIYAKRKAHTLAEQQRAIAEALPNVGPKLAHSLLSYFDTLENLATAPESELAEVEKIGKQKAAKLRHLFSTRYLPQKGGKEEKKGESTEKG
jgi:ERCC4-type nuclease